MSGPVSAEVTATDFDSMLLEGKKLSSIAQNVAIKVPLTFDGLRACKAFSDDGVMVNVTLCFSAAQALLAAKAGATFISPFIGRLDDIGADGMNLISDISEIYDIHGFETKVLAASIKIPHKAYLTDISDGSNITMERPAAYASGRFGEIVDVFGNNGCPISAFG